MIRNSGVFGNPIIFTAYRAGVKPIVRNLGTWTVSIKVNARYIIKENLFL